MEQLEFRTLLATVAINPIADTTLYESATGDVTNGAGTRFFAGVTDATADAGTRLRRGLLKFDVAAAIPAGARIDAVTLRLNMSRTNPNAPPPGTTDIALHAVLADWGEGTTDATANEGKGGPVTPNSATWVHRFHSATTWATQGGVFTTAASATTTVGPVGVYQWTGSQMVSDVQRWLDTPGAQFGWLAKAVNESVLGNAKRFDSREHATAANRPLLTIDYTPASAANKAPTLDAIGNPAAILEDASAQTVSLTGISAGAGETQTITVTAVSNNIGLIPNPTVTYTSPNATGSLSYTPVANQSGSAVITVTVKDNGGTAGGGVDTTTRSFTVAVTAVNDAPTLDAIGNPAAILEDAGAQTVNLAGITAGPGETQTITVTAVSSNPSLIPNPNISYTSPNATGTLSYTPVAHQSGTAVITVTVKDDGGTANSGADTTTRSFTVAVTAVNDAPTLDAIANPAAILEDAGVQTVNLAGIGPGPSETQALTVSAFSSNVGVIPNPTVTYTSPNATGTLSYTPVPNQSGTVTMTVTVMDDGGTDNGGVNAVTRTFTVAVTPVNDAPTLDAIGNPAAILEDAGAQTINLAGISAGLGESGTLSVTAASSNSVLIPDPTVTYSSPNATGSLAYTPVPNQSGTAVITIIVRDDGGTANGGVDTTTRTFTVTVTPVNDAPTLSPIANPAPLAINAGLQTVNFSGVSPGPNESQTLTVTATSSNLSLIPNPAVSYTSPNATGSLSYTPVANQSGTATITVTVKDDGGTANGGVDTRTQTFTVTVLPPAANQPPTLNPIADPAPILEDAGAQSVSLAGISAGGSESQTLTVTAASSIPGLIPNPTVSYASPNATGSLSYTPVANQSGTAVITVTVKDNGGTAGGGIDTTTRVFTVTVTAVNDAPTLDPISNPAAILEDAGVQTVNITGISAGPFESQLLTLTAVSSNPGLIPSPTVLYTSPNATGSLSYTPVANQFGSATITVTLRDNGGTANGGLDTTVRSFTVTVTPVNDAPTIDPIADPASILEDAGTQTVNLTGISAGPGESQVLTLTVISSNPGLIPQPTVSFTSPNATGSLSYTPVANQSGTAVITVTLKDDGGIVNGVDTITRQFTVTVAPVNDAPALDPIGNPAAILEDAGAQAVSLTGISAGPGELQTLTVTAISSNPGLIPNPTVSYGSPNASGMLSYSPVANQAGTATITVTIRDDGGTANGGGDTTTRSFTVSVTPVNDTPTLDLIADPAPVLPNAGLQSVNLSGISAGPNESQALTVSATSSNPSLIPHPSVAYASPNGTGSLSYTPVANQFGTATITVTVMDDGGTANGGVDQISRTFRVTVAPPGANLPPTLDLIPDPAPILEDAGAQQVGLNGISAGGNESQTLTVTAVSSNVSLIPNPTVTYISPDATGSLIYTPIANQSGTATITVTIMDNGGTANGGVNTTTQTFNVSVTPVNDVPTLNPISNPAAILEDAAAQAVALTGITAGSNESQTLTVTAVSNNPNVIPHPTVTYSSSDATGSLTYTPVANQSGTATITVTVTDNGGTASGGVDTTTRSFTVSVTPVNDAPALDPIADPAAILEDAGTQAVALSGISAGPGESQPLTVTAVSSNPSLIPNPTVTFTSPNAAGSLAYAPAANQSGAATITVTVTDNGGTVNGGIDTTTRTFTITVTPVNDRPTANPIADPAAILEDAGSQTVALSGISAGPGESQPLTVTAVSSNPSLIPNPAVTYSSPNATGSLAYAPLANQSGTATITVTVTDNGGTANGGIDTTTRTFTITVTPVNDVPTLDPIANPVAILEDSGARSINLTGISAGAGESQPLSVTAVSSNPSLIPNPTVTYTSPNATGTLAYTPVANQSGTATITVTVQDNSGTANGGVDTTTRSFTITVNPVNDAPGFVKGADQSVTDESPAQSIAGWATGLSRGAADEAGQTWNFEVTNSNNGVFLVQPAIDSSGRLTFAPRPNTRGTATVSVLLMDSGGTANGGVDKSPLQTFTIQVSKPFPWHNTLKAEDVSGDTIVIPLDALAVINYLNDGRPSTIPPDAAIGPPFYDTNRDGFVSPIDVLLIINFLNGNGEGEVEVATGSPHVSALVDQQIDLDAICEPRRRVVSELLAAAVEDAADQVKRRKRWR